MYHVFAPIVAFVDCTIFTGFGSPLVPDADSYGSTVKEKEILRLHFGIGEEAEHTMEEVGKRFWVTRERIRQIEAKSLRKLRHPLRGRNLRAFIET